jgi:hypothetical protein
VVPSWDLRVLWVNNDLADSDQPADGTPWEARPGGDPYNLYFTPNGRYAVVMASARRRIDFLDPHSMRLVSSTPAGCAGVNHADFDELAAGR